MSCHLRKIPMASDFHTHIPHPGKRELLDNGKGKGPLWSLPFHPWYTKEMPENMAEMVKGASAIGEMGFDKFRCETNTQEGQLQLFSSLLRQAAEFRKPVVLHWVGGFDKLFEAAAPFMGEVDFLFHGYAKSSPGLLQELLARGFYVSLSPRLTENQKIKEFIKSHPGCRVGLETDDDDKAEIEKLYDLMNIPGFEKAADEHFGAFLHL